MLQAPDERVIVLLSGMSMQACPSVLSGVAVRCRGGAELPIGLDPIPLLGPDEVGVDPRG